MKECIKCYKNIDICANHYILDAHKISSDLVQECAGNLTYTTVDVESLSVM